MRTTRILSLSLALMFAGLGSPVVSAESPAAAAGPVSALGWATPDDRARSSMWINLHVTSGESDGIQRILDEANNHNDPRPVPPGDARLPARYKVGGDVTVISKRGQSRARLEAFEVFFQEGTYFLGAKARSERPKPESGLVVNGPVSPKARLQTLRSKPLGAKEAPVVLAAVLATATEDARESLANSPLESRDLRVLTARAPAGGRLLLASQTNQGRKNGEPGSWTWGLFLLSKDGTLTSLRGPGLQSGGSDYTIPLSTDIDGDGIDELIEDTQWPEGSTTRAILRWNGTTYVATGL